MSIAAGRRGGNGQVDVEPANALLGLREPPRAVGEPRPPEGGFFLWLALPEGFDTQAMLPQAARSGVTYVPGRAFFHDGGGANLLRLRYSATPQHRIAEGVHRLIRTIRAWL